MVRKSHNERLDPNIFSPMSRQYLSIKIYRWDLYLKTFQWEKNIMEISINHSGVNLDLPLNVESALAHDKLSRGTFAQAAADILKKVSSTAGLVVSIEGVWGSGKTSTLALIEAKLITADAQPQPLIVHFNPWLIGEKDALLRHFLSRIAAAINMSDKSKDGKKVAKEIQAYSKAFDLVKLIPGAEPWASLFKSVFETAGNVIGTVADYKTPDIEVYKQKVEEVLRNFPRPIIVFIDDMDRLFPSEIFEMVRIIKAVGELPRVGYILAWDPAYVGRSLEKLGVPYADSYLDKVVQVRLPLPFMSISARRNLFNAELSGLDPQALIPRFKRQEDRLAELYHYGLRDLLEQPRDIARVFNAARLLEPLLRDEIVFADILGLTALSVKAPSVFDLLRKEPHLFVGRLPDDLGLLEKSKDVLDAEIQRRQAAYGACSSPGRVRQVIHHLFPFVAKADGSYALSEASYVEGVIAHPARLAIALQLSVTDNDVSIKAARRYLQYPAQRPEILAALTAENCIDFIDLLGDVGNSIQGESISDLEELCIAIASLPEQLLFVERARANKRLLSVDSEGAALRAIISVVRATDEDCLNIVAERIAMDSNALSCASEIITQSYVLNP
jgi:KAP family P-loop domain